MKLTKFEFSDYGQIMTRAAWHELKTTLPPHQEKLYFQGYKLALLSKIILHYLRAKGCPAELSGNPHGLNNSHRIELQATVKGIFILVVVVPKGTAPRPYKTRFEQDIINADGRIFHCQTFDDFLTHFKNI